MAFQEEQINDNHGNGDFYMNPSLNNYRQNGQIDEEEDSSSLDEPMLLHSSSYASKHIRSRTPTRPKRLAIPRPTFSRKNTPEWSQTRLQTRTVNQLEVENTYLMSQNSALNRDVQHCRETVQALKYILAQREETIERMKEDCQKAYMKSKFLESVLAEHHSLWQRNSVDGFMGQEEHRLDMLLRELREDELLDDDDDDEEEGVVGDADEEDFGEIRRNMNRHQPFSDEEEEEEEEEDLSDSDYGESSAPLAPGHRFRELNLEGLSPEVFAPQAPPNDQSSLHTDHSSRELPSDVYQQYSASFPPRNTNGPDAPASSPPVLRRRPCLQINSRFQEVTPLRMSLSFPGPGSYRAMPSNSSDLSLSSQSQSSEEDGNMTDDDNMDETVKREDEGNLRDSGHFPAEIFSSDTTVDQGDTDAIEQLQLPAVATKPANTSQAIETGSQLAVDCEYVGLGVTSRPGSFEGRGKSDQVARQCDEDRISLQRDSEGCLDEDRSESPVATIVSSATETSEQADTVDTLVATTDTAHINPVPKTAGSVFNSGITEAAMMQGGHSEPLQDVEGQRAESVLFMLPKEATTSDAAAASAPASKESLESLEESGGLRSTTSFLMRMFSGLGKQTAGVFVGRQSQDGTRQEKLGARDIDSKGGYIPDRSASPSLRDPIRKNALRVTGKGIGFRRLAHRRSRTLLTSPVSVVVTGGIARADKAAVLSEPAMSDAGQRVAV
ncbi:hypothetical protein BGZ58_008310 [Dissophora ornata]|nr:hypothetical protein BGZ58_008310 [Dissophora ornata]